MKNRNNVLTKLFLVFLLTALTIFILIFFVVRNYLNAQNIEIFKQDLNQKSQTILSSIIPLVSSQNIPALKQNIDKLSSSLGNRITLINPQGLVIADSQNDEKNMSDHFNRPEVKSVLEGANFGQDIRKSATDSQATLYYAIPIKTDEKLLGVLRLSIPINNVKAFENNTLRNILFTSVIIIFICIVAVYFIWRKFTKDISTLMDTISEISKGNFQVKAQIKSDSQVFQFAKALNKMSQDLEQLFLQTKEFDNLKKDFISNASHELKTPITAIVGFSQMLQTQELNDETKHYVEIIQKQSKRLSNIVTDILSLSDLENTDAKEIEKTDVEISTILDDIISLYQKKAEIKNLKIKKEAAADIKTIYANEFYLEQALINLIDNAIKYTEKGAIAIKVCAKNNFVQITVADTGLGIEQKHLPRLFDRFYVVDKSRSRASGGTGLGLAIVKHIAIVHNGFIEVESKVGKGSAFKMSLPLKAPLDS